MITEETRKELIIRTETHFWHHCCAIDDEECYATHEEEARVEMGLTRDQVSEILAVEFPLVGKCWDEWRKTAPAEQANDHTEDHRLCLDGGEESPTAGMTLVRTGSNGFTNAQHSVNARQHQSPRLKTYEP